VKPSDELLEYLARRMERSVLKAREIAETLAADPRPVTRKLAREILDLEGSPDRDEG
jgi:hypothetical protein